VDFLAAPWPSRFWLRSQTGELRPRVQAEHGPSPRLTEATCLINVRGSGDAAREKVGKEGGRGQRI
jgi:hypothetical protein